MPRNDFYCEGCEAELQDIVTAADKIHPRCECGRIMHINFGAIRFNRHLEGNRNNRMYGESSEFHYGFDCQVESYSHKQELLKKYNVSESADPVGGSRSWRDQGSTIRQTDDYDEAVELSESEVASLMEGDDQTYKNVAEQFEKE